jgi:hypothetical protein
MRIAKIISIFGALAMTAVLFFAFTQGDFLGEGSQLLSMPWGIVSLVDLYVGFTIFSAWVVYRERNWLTTIIWVALIMVLGFFTVSVYVFLALQKSNGDWKHFFFGKRDYS